MKGKRSLKKQQKRQASALAELEEIYHRRPSSQTDDEILARAVEIPDLAASPFAARWVEVAGRALRQSLAGGDLERLERLLGSFRRSGRPPSVAGLAALAEAVLDLAAGRFEVARSRLAELSDAAFPEGLLPALRNLARNECDRSDDPSLQAARELLQSLQDFDPEAVAHGFRALRAAAAEPAALLDSAESCLSLLTGLAALEADLEGDLKSDASPSRSVAAWLHGSAPSLTAALTSPPQLAPPLLAPLRHAVHLRWRAVLQRVAKREGSSGLAALYAAAPKLLSPDVDLPRGIQGNLATFRQRTEAQQLISDGRFRKLAELLRSRSRTVTETSTLAALWSLELWTYSRRAIEEDEADDVFSWSAAHPFDDPSPAHRALARLQGMAGEIRQRFPAVQRAEVARVLRAELFDLCEHLRFCEHAAGAALSLLEHLPNDIGLLIAGVAGAVSGEDQRAFGILNSQISQIPQAAAQPGDRAVARRLMIQVAMEGPWDMAMILDVLKPLFADDAWPEIAALVAREMAGILAAVLREEADEAMEEPEFGHPDLSDMRSNLDLLRQALAGTPGLAAAEMAIDCWQPDRRAAEKRLKKFLADVPGLEGPLTAFHLLERAYGPASPEGAAVASRGLAHAVIDRLAPLAPLATLDPRWELWCTIAPILSLAADNKHRRRLEEKIQQLLASSEIPAGSRGKLLLSLQAMQALEDMEGQLRRPVLRRFSPLPGKRASQLKLDLP